MMDTIRPLPEISTVQVVDLNRNVIMKLRISRSICAWKTKISRCDSLHTPSAPICMKRGNTDPVCILG